MVFQMVQNESASLSDRYIIMREYDLLDVLLVVEISTLVYLTFKLLGI